LSMVFSSVIWENVRERRKLRLTRSGNYGKKKAATRGTGRPAPMSEPLRPTIRSRVKVHVGQRLAFAC
jgi:hypothetical protein